MRNDGERLVGRWVEWACLVVKLRVAVKWSGRFSVRWIGSLNSCECEIVSGGNSRWLCEDVVSLRLWWTADGGGTQGCRGFDSTVYYAPYNVAWCGDMFSQPDWVLVQ